MKMEVKQKDLKSKWRNIFNIILKKRLIMFYLKEYFGKREGILSLNWREL